jgi:NADH-quinone oxidoreductase subunit K
MSIGMEQGMLLAALLFLVGLTGLLLRRDIVFMLMCVEIMLNAAGLAFIVAGSAWGKADGQIMFLFILTMAAAEVAVGLALIIQMFAKFKSVDTNSTNTMKG